MAMPRWAMTNDAASWGWPFDCDFCSVTAICEKKAKRIFFYDDNPAADKRRLKEMLRRMIDEGLAVQWMGQVRTGVVRDEELLDLMKRSGCLIVFLGLESVSLETLDAYDKHQTVEDISKGIRKLHEHGILSHDMFVLGADSYTLRTVHDTVDFALANRIDSIMMSALTPLPGTPQYEDLQAAGRIFDHRWEHYDSQQIVFRAKHLHAYGRLYAPAQWLTALLGFGATKLLLKSWGRWPVKSWRRDARNGAFIEDLRALPAPTQENGAVLLSPPRPSSALLADKLLSLVEHDAPAADCCRRAGIVRLPHHVVVDHGAGGRVPDLHAELVDTHAA